MKKTVLFVLVLCLCFAAFSPAFAETAVTEAPAAEELYQAGRDAVDAGDYGKAKEYFQLAADAGNAEGWRGIGNLYADGLGVEQSYYEWQDRISVLNDMIDTIDSRME